MSATRPPLSPMLRYFVLAIGLVLLSPTAHAQSAVQASVMGIPPLLPNPYVDQFAQDVDTGRFSLQVTVMGMRPVTTAWRVTLRRDGQDLVSAVSEPVVYEPGVYFYRTFDDSPAIEFDLSYGDIVDRLPGEVRDVVLQTGALPEGIYTVEVEPLPLGDVLSIAGVADFEVLFPDPPQLVVPYGDELVTQPPLFAWTPVVTTLSAPVITYRVQIVEVIPGQTPAAAIAANRPVLDTFVEGLTVFAYTPDLYPLQPERRYAWFVVAEAEGTELPIREGGASDVTTFVYRPLTALFDSEDPIVQPEERVREAATPTEARGLRDTIAPADTLSVPSDTLRAPRQHP